MCNEPYFIIHVAYTTEYDEKCVCLEYCKARNQTKIEIIYNYLNRLRKIYMNCWKRNFITTKLFNYEYEVTMITPLNDRVVVHFVKLLIKIAANQVTPLLEEKCMCLSLLLSEAKCKIILRLFPSFPLLRNCRLKKWKNSEVKEKNKKYATFLIFFHYYCIILWNFSALDSNRTQYTACIISS
jgi:uncharacterized Rmd1/YagE family protein